MPKFLSLGLLTIALTIPLSNVHAEVFKLTKVEIAKEDPLFPAATIKTYQASKPVNVKYSYFMSPQHDRIEFFMAYDEKQTGIQTLLNYGSYVDNIDSAIVKNKILKIMPKLKANDECYYVGTATVKLKDIQFLDPEVAAEIETWATIVDVLKISTPKKDCS